MVDFGLLGIIGFANLSALSCIVIWRWWAFSQQEQKKDIYKRVFFFSLFFSSICDLPMYLSFIISGEYSIATFAFHKFQGCSLFVAYTITILDWSSVLYAIHEEPLWRMQLRNGTLYVVNAVFIVFSFINFGFCFSSKDLSSYTNSPVYTISLFLQIIAQLCVTCVMLVAGMKLSWRIKGASGANDRQRRIGPTSKELEFQHALWRLNAVMATCAVFIILQVSHL